MNKLILLTKMCICGIEIEINPHKTNYTTVQNYLNDPFFNKDIEKDIFNEMIKANCIIHIICYSDTPTAFYEIYHYDLDKALTDMIEIVSNADNNVFDIPNDIK